MTFRFPGILRVAVIGVAMLPAWLAGSGVTLNEIVSSNGSTVADEDGSHEDWVELHNPGGTAVDLSGWGLSDSPATPFKWVFPAGSTIGADGYLLVWASGKDRRDPAAPLHTNFAISASGETIVLTPPGGPSADSVALPALPRNTSYGRKPGGDPAWYFFDQPTPGAANTTPGFGSLPPVPSFSAEAGFHTTAFGLELGTEPGWTIYYTLDGSDPDPARVGAGAEPYRRTHTYTAPITVASRAGDPNVFSMIPTTRFIRSWLTPWRAPVGEVFKATVVRAAAYESESGRLGHAVTRTFFVDPNITTRYQGMPVVSLVSDYVNLFDDSSGIYVPGSAATKEAEQNFNQGWRRPAHVEFIEAGDSTPAFADRFEISIQGSSSRNSMHKGLNVVTGDESASRTIEYPLFGARGTSATTTGQFRRFILRAWGSAIKWPVLFSDAHHQTMAAHSDLEIQDYRPVVVFINGEYWGLHELRESIKNSWYHQFRTGIDRDSPGFDLLDDGGAIVDEGDADHWNALWAFIDANNLADDGAYEHITTRVDVENLARYIAHCVICGKRDWPQQNESLWRPRTADGRWRWSQFDMDHGLMNWSSPQHNMFAQVVDGPISNYGPHALFKELLANERFKRLFVNTCLDWLNSYFLTEVELAHFDALKAELDPFVAEYNNRWPIRDSDYMGWEDGCAHGRNLISGSGSMQSRRNLRRSQLIQQFAPGTPRSLILDTDPAMGRIRCNSVVVDETLPGADPAAPYPWQRSYYQNYPVALEAIPRDHHRFVGWVVKRDGLPLPPLPDGDAIHYSRGALIDLAMTGAMTVEAVFEPFSYHALHVWDFENASVPVPSFTVGGGLLRATPSPNGEIVLNGLAQDFTTTHLRVNHPIGAQLEWALPTTGCQSPRLGILTRRSALGAGTQHLWYTLDGQSWTLLESYAVLDAAPQFRQFDFAGVDGSGGNPDFAVRITFGQGDGGTAGNNRFDDVRLEAVPLPGFPLVTAPLPDRRLAADGNKLQIDLADHFLKAGGGSPDFEVLDDPVGVASLSVDGSILEVEGLAAGQATVEVLAMFNGQPAVSQGFNVQVDPPPFVVASGVFRFDAWSPVEQAWSYPPNMVFLQSEVSDPVRDTPLPWVYHIPPQDAARAIDVDYPYGATSRTRINGRGNHGISFINTGRGRDVGGAIVALDTTGRSDIQLKWKAGTVTPNTRIYALSLQYRLGHDGDWIDFTDESGNTVDYVSRAVVHEQSFGPFKLPPALEDQPYVQLQWRYHHLSGSSGPRAELRLDDIVVYDGRSYEGWAIGSFTDAEAADPERSGMLADYAGDGVPNLVKYALGLAPGAPVTDARLRLRATRDGQMSARFHLDRALTGIVYQLQVSADLNDWSEVVYDSSEDAGPNSHGTMHEVNLPPDGSGRRFLRLAVVHK